MITRVVADSFLLSFQIASPFILVAQIFVLGLGMLSRIMPQMQVFFVAMPLQIGIGLTVLAAVLPAVLHWFVSAFENAYIPFILP